MTGSLRSVAGPPQADEQYRARALAQLWRLRDDELVRAGHSTPAYIAARVANEFAYPRPPRPRSKADLDQYTRRGPMADPKVAAWCDEDRQIVTGEHRAALMQWLPEVVSQFTTKKQMYVLDGYTERTSLSYVRELLASEGFQQVRDVYGNAGSAPAPRALYDYSPLYHQARVDAAVERRAMTSLTVTNRVALVLCSPTDGFLATVHATEIGGRGLEVVTVDVFYNVMVLDRELYWCGVQGGGLALDENRNLITIDVGGIGNVPVYRSGGSLRVGLAALRAFARPVAPWYAKPYISLGEDTELLDRVDEILTGLPTWVHDLLGPQLTTPYRLLSNQAA
jgi:hypothetical protein